MFLRLHSAHQKSSVNSESEAESTRLDNPGETNQQRKSEGGLIVNHFVHYSAMFRCISTLGKVDFTSCGSHAVSRRRKLPSITAYSKYLCGQLDSAVAVESHQWCSNTLQLAACLTLWCSSVAVYFVTRWITHNQGRRISVVLLSSMSDINENHVSMSISCDHVLFWKTYSVFRKKKKEFKEILHPVTLSWIIG